MNVRAQQKLLVQSLKGSRAQVLLAFLLVRRAMDIQELKEWTGLKRETIYGALESLDGIFLASQTLAHGRKVWLPGGDMLPLFQESEKRTSGELLTTAADSTLDKNSDALIVVVGSQESEKRTSGPKEPTYESYDASFEKNWQACRKAGIGEPKRTEIALMPHVTPRLILDHARSLIPGEAMGLAIRRIESDEVPRCWLEDLPTRGDIERRQHHLDADDVEEVEEP